MDNLKAIIFFFVAIFYKKCLWLSKLIYWLIYFTITIYVLTTTDIFQFSSKLHMLLIHCNSVAQIVSVMLLILYTFLTVYIDKNASISVEFLTTFEKRDNISSWEFWKTIFKLKK